MYNDKLEVANKIITDKDLEEIFVKMNDDMILNKQLANQEKIQNEKYEYEYQHWSLKYFDGSFKCTINFYDDTDITFDNYDNFISIFNSRISEIKDMWLRYNYSYTIQHGKEQNSVSQHIYMFIYEDKMSIDASISSLDNKMNDIYKLIKDKIDHANVKYDRIIKEKNKISTKVSFAIGIIPSLVICTLLALIPVVRHIYSITILSYPILVLLLTFVIGATFSASKLEPYYKSIMPKKKYDGYDSYRGKSIYKDDIDNFVGTSEIIIGKNVNNIHNRKEIEEVEEKYSKNIPYYILTLIVLSIVVVITGFFI